MLPWNYGFHWNLTSYIFLGAFYTVLVVVATTVLQALWRSRRALQSNQAEAIRWAANFHDLPARDRACRHALTGEAPGRECPHAFDCRQCETHPKLLAAHPPAPAGPEDAEIFGLSFPQDRYYHRGHTWARPESDGTVSIGLDDLGQRLLGTPDAIDLPMPGTPIRANGLAFRVRKRNADVRVLSPIDGEVVAIGGPDRDWLLKVKPPGGACDLRHLLTGAEVKAWVMRELERLQLTLSVEGAAPTLADGGVPVADIAASYPEADWDAVCGEMFLEA